MVTKTLLVSLAAAFAVALAPGAAQADRRARGAVRGGVRVGGGVHVRGGARVVVRPSYPGVRRPGYVVRRPGYVVRPYRPAYRPYRSSVYVAPWFYVGAGVGYQWAEPPPPVTYVPAPTYGYAPAPASMAPPVMVAQPQPMPAPRLPWLGVGLRASSTELAQGDVVGEGAGLVVRVRGGQLELELEAGQDEYFDLGRTDGRLGVDLHLNLTRSWIAPYLLVGGGMLVTEFDSSTVTAVRGYLEAGGGLALRATNWLTFEADLRVSTRHLQVDGDMPVVHTPVGAYLPPEKESALEGRLAGIVYF